MAEAFKSHVIYYSAKCQRANAGPAFDKRLIKRAAMLKVLPMYSNSSFNAMPL